MTQKRSTYVALVFLMMVGILYYINAQGLSGSSTDDTIGPSYFPSLLAGLLIILCVVSFIKTILSKQDSRIELSGFKLGLVTIVLTSLFIFSVSTFGFFYVQVFVLLVVLTTIYRYPLGMKIRLLSTNIAISLTVTFIFYAVFDVVMAIRF